MKEWQKQLKFDPLSYLNSSDNAAIEYFVDRDLLEREMGPIERLWDQQYAQKIIKKQLDNGSWKHPGKPHKYPENMNLFATFKSLRELVPKYGINKKHKCIQKAAEYVFSCQTEEGDIRGIYCNQYMTNYMGALMELLNMAGYHDDARIERGFQWLLSMRHTDGGWGLAMLTAHSTWQEVYALPDPVPPDKSKPSSHWLTGMVLRAFAAHPKYRKSKEAREAGKLLISRFFQKDKYSSRRDISYWFKFYYPFFWTDLLSSLDSISLLGFSKDEPQIDKALQWFKDKQQTSGFWILNTMMGARDKDTNLWLNLAICRVFKRFYDK
jgi:hypothetical protein